MTETDPTPLDDAAIGATWVAVWTALGRPVPAGLQTFLDRRRLHHGEHAVALLEAQARINLAAALSRLAQ